MKLFFWISLFIVFYTFVGYGILLFFLIKIKRIFFRKKKSLYNLNELPTLTLIVAAYNEADIIEEKIKNTFDLKYPSDKISFIFVTDGSTDNSPQKISTYKNIQLLHSKDRKGKIHAMHRAMDLVKSEVTVFTDANTFLNGDAVINIARHYSDQKVGAVSGEKRVLVSTISDSTAGEGFYWKYESLLKKWDSELYSVVGAAGELFSVRTSLYQPVPPDTILDDFMISLVIASKGYRIIYEPDAFAMENSSLNTTEELKRKVRIAAGGIQSILRLKSLLNPFHHTVLSFQYISHRVLRWTITPFFMIITLLLNIIVTCYYNGIVYKIILGAQLVFYILALAGWLFERKQIKVKLLFVPFYFCMMNVAVIMGIKRYFLGTQNAAWEKVKRK
ncbi:MAG: glycosyltransferase family 2 protein [Bacteroidota bacterium]|nr:glycosyltransferase family 2 protein [Bacteroidota bacterium]